MRAGLPPLRIAPDLRYDDRSLKEAVVPPRPGLPKLPIELPTSHSPLHCIAIASRPELGAWNILVAEQSPTMRASLLSLGAVLLPATYAQGGASNSSATGPDKDGKYWIYGEGITASFIPYGAS